MPVIAIAIQLRLKSSYSTFSF